MPIIEAIRASGITSPSALARELDQRGIVTLRGGKWGGPTVKRLPALCGATPEPVAAAA